MGPTRYGEDPQELVTVDAVDQSQCGDDHKFLCAKLQSLDRWHPALGAGQRTRWRLSPNPAGFPHELQGWSVLSWRGIGPATTGSDPYYNAANNAWLIARFDYTLTGVLGQTSLFLQIGPSGLSNQGETSSATSVVFGSTTDAALNANSQRLTNSATADATIVVSATAPQNANFNGDAFVDGRDFLIWQRGYGIAGGASLSQGDANGDLAVNGADLAIWNQQYGTSGGLMAVVPVPEPGLSTLIIACFAMLFWKGSYRSTAVRRKMLLCLAIVATAWSAIPNSASAEWDEQFKITASDANEYNYYGISVAISGDNAIVGAYGTNAAYLIDAATGDERFILNDIGSFTSEILGTSVGIDGNYAIAGDVFDDGVGGGSGAAYLYDVFNGQELFKLTPSDGAFADSFGNSVAVSGNVAIVGAPQHNNGAGDSSGAAYLYDVTTGNELFKLVPSDPSSFDHFGQSVSISGNIAVVGSPYNGGFTYGAAYLFDVTTGNQIHKLTALDGAPGDSLGYSVAIDGNTVAVGANHDSTTGSQAGSAYLFNATSGAQIRELTATNAFAGNNLGTSVGISGNMVLVGSTGGAGPQAKPISSTPPRARNSNVCTETMPLMINTPTMRSGSAATEPSSALGVTRMKEHTRELRTSMNTLRLVNGSGRTSVHGEPGRTGPRRVFLTAQMPMCCSAHLLRRRFGVCQQHVHRGKDDFQQQCELL